MRYPEYFLWHNPTQGQPMWLAMSGLVGLEFEALASLANAYIMSGASWVWANPYPGREHPAVEDWNTMQASLLGYVNDKAVIELEREADKLLPGWASA